MATTFPALDADIIELSHQPTAEEVDRFRASGVGVVRQVLSPAEVMEIRQAYMAGAEAGPVEGLSEATFAQWQKETDPLKRYPRMLHPHRHTDLPVGKLRSS